MDDEFKKLWEELISANLDNKVNLPSENDYWNVRMSKIIDFEHVQVASFIKPNFPLIDIKTMIIVEPDTSRKDIDDDWYKISEYRDKLANYFGKPKKSDYEYLQSAFRLHRDFDMGYGTIAKFLNFHILVLFFYGLLIKMIKDHELSYFFAYASFIGHLVAFGYSEEEAEKYLANAVDDLGKGDFPWRLTEGPFSTARIREYLRPLVDKNKKETLILNKVKDALILYCNHEDIEDFLINLYRYRFKLRNSDLILIKQWRSIKNDIIKDYKNNFTEYDFPRLPGMGEIDSFLP